MSYNSQADTDMEEVRTHVRLAVQLTGGIVSKSTNGWDAYSSEFLVKLRRLHGLLIDVDDDLNNT